MSESTEEVVEVKCAAQFAEVKVLGGARVHFLSGDCVMEAPAAVVRMSGLKLKTDAPAMVVVQPFMADDVGRSLGDTVATTVRKVSKTELIIAARWQSDAPGRFVGPLAVRFDIMVHE